MSFATQLWHPWRQKKAIEYSCPDTFALVCARMFRIYGNQLPARGATLDVDLSVDPQLPYLISEVRISY